MLTRCIHGVDCIRKAIRQGSVARAVHARAQVLFRVLFPMQYLNR